MSQEATMLIIDYLLSDNGRFLREPLLNEIVETIDSLGITAATIVSLLSNRVIPGPTEKPDKRRVLQFIKILDTITSSAESKARRLSVQPFAKSPSSGEDEEESVEAERLIRIGNNLLRYLGDGNTLSFRSGQTSSLQPVLNKASVLLRQVVIRLLEKNARRAVRQVVTPKNVERSFPVISTLLDLLPKL